MERITHDLLRRLQAAGYNVLKSDRRLPDDEARLSPIKVDDLDECINRFDSKEMMDLVIEEGLGKNEEELRGFILTPENT